jgi:tetratricopeptide (TPR) repeat protein
MIILFFITWLVATFTQQQVSTVTQTSSGWCSPNITNVSGNVTVICKGVDPRALKRLNHELDLKNLQYAEKFREADEWAERYHDLEKRLAESGDDTELSKKAEEYLREGDLENATAILDEILAKEEREVDRTAANNFNRALISELQFKPLDALPFLEKAHRYRPENLKYALSYAELLETESKFTTAEDVLLPSLKIARERSNDGAAAQLQLAQALSLLGHVYTITQRLAKAKCAYKEALDIYDRPEVAKSGQYGLVFRKISLLIEMGRLYAQTQRLPDAYDSYNTALEISEPLANENSTTYLLQRAELFDELGNLHRFNHELPQAEDFHTKAVAVWKQLKVYLPYTAQALTDLANDYDDDNKPDDAAKAYEEALELIRPAAKENPPAFEPLLANILSDAAAMYRRKRNFDKALKDSLAELEIYTRLAKSDSVTFTPDLSASLNSVAKVYHFMGNAEVNAEIRSKDYSDAECFYQKALNIRKNLAASSPEAFRPAYGQTLRNLGELYGVMRENDKAVTTLKEAAEAYSLPAENNSDQYSQELAFIWQDLGHVYTDMNQDSEANDWFKKSIAQFRLLAKDKPTLYTNYLANALQSKAFLSYKRGLYSEALTYIKEVVEIREQLNEQHPLGPDEQLAVTLLLEAQLLQEMKSDCAGIIPLAKKSAEVSSSEATREAATAIVENCGKSN